MAGCLFFADNGFTQELSLFARCRFVMLSNMIANRLAIFWVWRKENLSLLINRNLLAYSVFGFRRGQISPLTLYLLVLFADNFCKKFGPRSGPAKCRAWSASKLFDTLIVFLKKLLERVNARSSMDPVIIRNRKRLVCLFVADHLFKQKLSLFARYGFVMLSNMIMNRLAIYLVWRKENLSLLINRNLRAVSVFGFRGGQISLLTLYLLVSFADNFCKIFGPRSGPTKCRAWSGSKLFDTLFVFLKNCLKKLIL